MNEIGFNNIRKGRSKEETVQTLLDGGIELLVVTLAENGCVIFDAETRSETRIPGVPSKVVDVTGAGDTFCSTFTNFYMFQAIFCF